MHLETERLLIRDFVSDDAEAAFRIYGDPEVMKYLGGSGTVASLDEMQERLGKIIEKYAGRPKALWAVADKETKELVGGAILKELPDGTEIEVGYHFAKAHWGKGYATEVTKALLMYGFENLELQRIVGVTFPDNKPSQRVLLKAGLKADGQCGYLEHTLDRFVIERDEWVAASKDLGSELAPVHTP